MLINRRTIRIEWGDCDPAGIVYFPRYFEYFDSSTRALFERAGFTKPELLKRYKIIGIPVVDMKARFMMPSRFGEDAVIESAVTKWGTSSFVVQHRLMKGEDLAVECLETRVWAAQSNTDHEKIESRPIPSEVKEKFAAVAASEAGG